jgi:hypothetical protein
MEEKTKAKVLVITLTAIESVLVLHGVSLEKQRCNSYNL